MCKLYVTNLNGNSVSVFDTAHGNAVLPAITGGVNYPRGVAVDATGKLYVTNEFNTVSVFDTTHANAELPQIAGGGLACPTGAVVDTSGRLYVSNCVTLVGDYRVVDSVRVFDTAHGNAVLPPITGGGLDGPEGVALDASGKLYVSDLGGSSVSVFDTAHGNTPLPQISGGGLSSSIAGLAVDAGGKLYVPNLGSNSVSVFDTVHGNAVLPAITGGGLDEPSGGSAGGSRNVEGRNGFRRGRRRSREDRAVRPH